MLPSMTRQPEKRRDAQAYVFEDAAEIVIRGKGPFGARLMQALAGGWRNVQAHEVNAGGTSRWTIRIGSDDVSFGSDGQIPSWLAWVLCLVVGYAAGAGFYLLAAVLAGAIGLGALFRSQS